MKIHKLIELWKEMEEGMETGYEVLEEMNPEEILNDLLFLERCAKRAGYYESMQLPSQKTETLKLSVEGTDQGLSYPVTAQLKLWDNKEHEIRSRFSLRRLVTNEEGTLELALPCGSYEAEISCGPEYETVCVAFSLSEGKAKEINAKLKRIAHLTAEGWMAGDLHHHSVYSSPAYGGTDPVIESPHDVCLSMKSLGMQFGALSDHHNTLNHEEWRKETKDFTPILSKEISTSNGHVLQLGVDDDVIYEIPKGSNRNNETLRKEFIRICSEIREKGGLPQVNHPFDISFSTRYNSEFWDMVEIFESMEIWNGATPFMKGTINYKAFKKWMSLLDEGKYLTATAGSDTHNIYGDDYFWMAEQFAWLIDLVETHPEIYPVQMQQKVEYLIKLYHGIFPKLMEWVAKSNSPSTIHNYVYTQGKKKPEEILDAIRAGRVFVSNGPLLTVDINGAGIGDTACLTDNRGDLKINLLSKEPLQNLYIYTGAEKFAKLQLQEHKNENCCFDYSLILGDYDFADAKWVVIFADGGENASAIANPIRLERR